MAQMLFKWMIVSLVLSSIVILGIVLFPYNTSDIEAFMTAPENCGGDCLLGVQPGISTVGETMSHLREHPWVSEVRQFAPGNGFSRIAWDWSGEQPSVIDASREGRMTFYWVDEFTYRQQISDRLIETITIHTHMRMYSLQTVLGDTNSGAVSFRPGGNLAYTITYDIPGGVTNLYAEFSCPLYMMQYWDARARITMTIGRMDGTFIHPMYLPEVCENGTIDY